MKLKNYLPLLAVAVLLLSSCGSLSITQKRYSRGLNIDWFAAKEDKGDTKKQPAAKPKRKVQVLAVQDQESTGTDRQDLNSEAATTTVNSATETVSGMQSTVLAYTGSKPAAGKSIRTKIQVARQSLRMMSHRKPAQVAVGAHTDKSAESDVNLVLLVILALFIPPLAVFLYFGEIETHFWINILLLLIGGGIYATTSGGLFIGLAVIHALLVVFGIFG